MNYILHEAIFLDEEERKLASECLEKCKDEFVTPLLEGRPLRVKVEGLEIMNDDPSEVDVVYAKVGTNPDSDVLQRLADGLVNRYIFFKARRLHNACIKSCLYFSFVTAGLMVKQYDRVKLHLTLINTLFRTESGICDNEASQNH